MKRAAVIWIIIIAVVFLFSVSVRVSVPVRRTENFSVRRTEMVIKGTASWYSQDDPGILETTANMEIFDDSRYTCAMWDVPFNTILKVTNLRNGRFVIVRVNDRGPARRLNRVIDLTKSAFSQIADLEKGLAEVSVEII